MQMKKVSFFIIISILTADAENELCAAAQRAFVKEKYMSEYISLNEPNITLSDVDVYLEMLLNRCTFSDNSAMNFTDCMQRCSYNENCMAFSYIRNGGCKEYFYSSVHQQCLFTSQSTFVDVAILRSFSNGKYDPSSQFCKIGKRRICHVLYFNFVSCM